MLDTAFGPVLRTVLDSLRTAVIVVDSEGVVVHSNPAANRSLSSVLAKRTVGLSVLKAAVAAAGADAMIVRLRRGDVPEVLHAGLAEAPSTLAAREREAILERLEHTGWKLAETARQLGISRTTLWRRLRAYGLRRGDRTK